MSNKKVAYLVVNEDIGSELLKRQVVELLCNIQQRTEDVKITLFLFASVLTILNHYKSIKEVKLLLRSSGVGVVLIPNLCPWPIPNIKFYKSDVGYRPSGRWNRPASITFSILGFPIILCIRFILGFKVFHCRSYPALLPVIIAKRCFSSIKVIFDPRSDFPEENVTSGSWKYMSEDYSFWKQKEFDFLKSSDRVALIGPTYLQHYKGVCKEFSYFFAPNNVNCANFMRNNSERSRLRSQYGISSDESVFVYLGNISRSGWHRAEYYFRFFDELASLDLSCRIMFLVPKHCQSILKELLGERDGVMIFSPDFDDVGKYLSMADYGLMFLHKSKIAVGTKIGEYLAASLPVVINKNCVGACELLQRMPQCGKVVGLGLGDLDECIDLTDLSLVRECQDTSAFAQSYFDNSVISKAYIQQYRELLH